MVGMENIENLLNIYNQLHSCTDLDDVETLKKSLNLSNIQSKDVEKESDRDSCKNGGSNELGIRNVGKRRMLSVADKSREVDELIKEAKELVEIGKFGEDLTIEVHEEVQVQCPTSNLVGDKFRSYIHEISYLLTKNKATTIGVWGMGGVGKTTLIKHLHNMMLDKPQIYGSVYWITVSKDWTIQKLQNDIAKRIGASISGMLDESQRAGILADALKRKKKFVLILDDMWSDFDSNEVGLGFPKEIGYRLIVTSRSKDVCLKMYCDNIIEVDPLSPEDAWTLFVRSRGREIPDDLLEASIDVVDECGGLPLGIITLAKTMIGCNDVSEWRNVLDELRNSSGRVDDMEEKVFKVLRLSYERLKDELKECLLYCAAYPEDFQIGINELIWLFIDAGLLGKNVGMTKMFDKGLGTLKKLERAALLSIDEVHKIVFLHDLIRDMALQIASSRFMIKAPKLSKDISDQKSWTDELEVVFIVDSEIGHSFDLSPKCKRLSTLLLQRNYLFGFSDGFFRYLHGLKHLDLSNSLIMTLPKSISLLKNLIALILRNCQGLQNVPSLAKLTSLERLDLCQTSIGQLPEGIRSLIKLRYLNLSSTNVRRIGAGVISTLTALQYLVMDARFDVKELNALKNLEHLGVVFINFVCFSTFIKQMKINGRPKSYTIALGNVENARGLINRTNSIYSEKRIYLRETESPDVNQYNHSQRKVKQERRPEIKRKAKLSCANELKKVPQDIHLLDILGDGDLMSLGDFVFDTGCNLQRQSKIGGAEPFSNLKWVELGGCPNLKKLFPWVLSSNLQNIEEIIVYFCKSLEELIEETPDETILGVVHLKNLSLPKLRYIRMENLPSLQSLCSDNRVIRTPALRWIEITSCPQLKRMPFEVDSRHQPFPQMIYSEEEKEWVDSLDWDPPQSKSMVHFKEVKGLIC